MICFDVKKIMNSQVPHVLHPSIDIEIQNAIHHARFSANTTYAVQYQQNHALKHTTLCLADMAVWLMTNSSEPNVSKE